MSSVLRARSPLFSYDSETGSRRPRWFVLLAGLLVLLLSAVGVVGGVAASASAHTPVITADCYQVKVDLKSYDKSGNTISVAIDGQPLVEESFGQSLMKSYPITDPTRATNWTVIVTAKDDPNFTEGYSVEKSGTTNACAAPDLTLDGTVCNTVDGTTTLTATISRLAQGQTYRGTLLKNDVESVDSFVATTAGKTWPDLQAGAKYTLTVTSDQQPGLTKSVSTFIVGCPQNSALEVSANQCTAVGASNASVAFTASSVVAGRPYRATLYQNGTAYNGGTFFQDFTPTAGQSTVQYTIAGIPANLSGLTVVLEDLGSGATVTSKSFASDPCPVIPSTPVVKGSECTVVGGSLELTVEFGGLVPTRVYEVFINGSKVDEFTAPNGAVPAKTYPLTAGGSYTVSITDKAAPAATAAAAPVTVRDCPTQPAVDLALTECTVPGGTGTLTATLSSLGTGRSYTVTLTEGAGNAVPGYPATTVTAGAAPIVYSGLTAGASYTVTIVDVDAPGVLAASSRTLAACPDTPTISVTPRCELLSDTTSYGVTLDKLQAGQQYVVTITDAQGADAAPPVTVVGGAGGNAPTFQVPNNAYYTVAVTAVANSAITASVDVFAKTCDLPTFPLPPEFPELPTLALTGAGDTTMPMLGALGLVQFGVALLALAAMLQYGPKRRRA